MAEFGDRLTWNIIGVFVNQRIEVNDKTASMGEIKLDSRVCEFLEGVKLWWHGCCAAQLFFCKTPSFKPKWQRRDNELILMFHQVPITVFLATIRALS